MGRQWVDAYVKEREALGPPYRSCVCNKALHNYTWVPEAGKRRLPGICCPCPEDCLCHG